MNFDIFIKLALTLVYSILFLSSAMVRVRHLGLSNETRLSCTLIVGFVAQKFDILSGKKKVLSIINLPVFIS